MNEKWPAVGEVLEVSGSPECTKYYACASKIAQRTLNAQLAKTSKMNEAVRLCMKKAHGRRRVGSGWQSRMHEVLRLCIKIARRKGNAQLIKTHQMHEALRLCI